MTTTQDFSIVYGPGSLGEYWESQDGSLDFYSVSTTGSFRGMIFSIPKDGIISHIGYPVGGKSGATGTAYLNMLSTLDDNGYPTFTNYGGSSGTVLLLEDYTAGSWNWVELSEHATGTAGDLVTARIECIEKVASSYLNVGISIIFDSAMPRIVHGSSYSFSTATQGNMPAMAVKFTDGEVYGLPIVELFRNAFRITDTPDEVGAKFTPIVSMTCNGMFVMMDHSASVGVPLSFLLYDENDVLLTSTFISNEKKLQEQRPAKVHWSEVDLIAGKDYRITVHTDSASLFAQVSGVEFNDADEKYCLPEGLRWQRTYRTNTGTWTDTPELIPYMALSINKISFITGTAGGVVGGDAGSYGWVS